jgi:putative ATP-binding cassette transporter
MNVLNSFWGREFFNSLQNKDQDAFINLLLFWHHGETGLLPGFVWIAAVFILVAVYQLYLRMALQIRWRRWLTRQFLAEWLADRAYYNISLTADRAAIGTDNPDQRLTEDMRDFCQKTLTLSLDLLSNVVSVFSFAKILWDLSGAITLFGISIPGYMLWVAIAYALFGSVLTHLIGRPLSILNFRQQRVEADFRYALMRFRENMEAIALYRGEKEESTSLRERFAAVIGNWRAIMGRTKLLNSLVNGYAQIAVIFPIVVAAPRYFSGAMQLGGMMQTVGAFSSVQDSLSWFVQSYAQIAEWRAIVERLATFQRAIVTARANAHGAFVDMTSADGKLHLHDITIALPDGTNLLEAANLTLDQGHSVVITGRTGSGKSTLFRVLAGIWPFGKGLVQLPDNAFFLPQRPYIPLGTLRHVITYPHATDAYSDAALTQALQDAGLRHLAGHLGNDENWPQRLSGGEQQRIALARALLARPRWIFLDEATASLDPEAEADLYRVLKQRLPDTTIVSIAHRPSVAALHDQRLIFQRDETGAGRLVTAPGE